MGVLIRTPNCEDLGKTFSYPNNFCLFYIAVVMDGCIIVFLEFFMQSNNRKTTEKLEKSRTQTEES